MCLAALFIDTVKAKHYNAAMVFSSISFLFFFLPTVLLLYFIIPSIRAKNILLLVASLIFYAWGEPSYIVIMLISIVLNYIFGLLLSSPNIPVVPPPHKQRRPNTLLEPQ